MKNINMKIPMGIRPLRHCDAFDRWSVTHKSHVRKIIANNNNNNNKYPLISGKTGEKKKIHKHFN